MVGLRCVMLHYKKSPILMLVLGITDIRDRWRPMEESVTISVLHGAVSPRVISGGRPQRMETLSRESR